MLAFAPRIRIYAHEQRHTFLVLVKRPNTHTYSRFYKANYPEIVLKHHKFRIIFDKF